MEGARERRRNEGNGRVGAMGEERPESFLLPRPIYPLPSIRYFSRLGGDGVCMGVGKGWEPRYRHPSPSPCPSNQENLLKIPGIFLVPWDGKTGLSFNHYIIRPRVGPAGRFRDRTGALKINKINVNSGGRGW